MVVAAALAALAGCGSIEQRPQAGTADGRKADALYVIGFWANPSALEARRLIDEYGPPDEVYSSKLVWRGRGAWARTAVWDLPPQYVDESEKTVVEQTVLYPLGKDEIASLQSFSSNIVASRSEGTLGVRTNDEQVAYLTLNLADEIVKGEKSVDQAKVDYRRIQRLRDSGKESPYLMGLLFSFGGP